MKKSSGVRQHELSHNRALWPEKLKLGVSKLTSRAVCYRIVFEPEG